MNEATIRAALASLLRAELHRYVIFRHEDKSVYGMPDISITGHYLTSWWEVKFANPDFTSRGHQELTMKRLENVGIARYLIYGVRKGAKFTRIVLPSELDHWSNAGEEVPGHDHPWVMSQIRRLHHDSV